MQYAGEAISICNSCLITLSILGDNSSTGDSGGMTGDLSDNQLLKHRNRFRQSSPYPKSVKLFLLSLKTAFPRIDLPAYSQVKLNYNPTEDSCHTPTLIK